MVKNESRGQSAVELALALPVFLLLLVGIVDYGRGVASYALVANAAREGARAGIFPHTSDDVIRAGVNSHTLFLGTIPASHISITPASQADRDSNTTIQVAVVYYFQPLLSSLLGWATPIRMSATSTMLIE